MSKEVVTTTTTKEYDEDGKLVRETCETVTEHVAEEEQDTPEVHHHYYYGWTWWPTCHHSGCCCSTCRPNYYVSQPSITWTGTQTISGGTTGYGTTYTINSTSGTN